jgi:hypothetical protein
MNLNLSDTYSLFITISFELNDVSILLNYQKEVRTMEIIVLLLATYYQNIITILMIAGKMRA